MANFVITNSTVGGTGTSQNLSTTYKTINSVVGAQTQARRGKIYDFLMGTNGAPADNEIDWDVARATALTTTGGTTITPNALDPADTFVSATATANSTTEPTVTSNSDVWVLSINQRASYRWVAAPGSELVWPATSCSGFVFRSRSLAYTGTVTLTAFFQEQ